jgi:hypothetical protein
MKSTFRCLGKDTPQHKDRYAVQRRINARTSTAEESTGARPASDSGYGRDRRSGGVPLGRSGRAIF